MNTAKNRPMIKKSQIFPLVALMITTVFCAALIGAPGSLTLSAAVLGSSLFSVFIFTRSGLCVALVAIPAAYFGFNMTSVKIAAYICAVIVGIAASAYVAKIVRSLWIVGMIPVAYLLALVFSWDPSASLMSLAIFPAGITLAFGISDKNTRVGTICRTAVVLGLTATVVIVAWLALTGRFSDPAALPGELLDKLIDYYTKQYAELAERYSSVMSDAAVKLSLTADDAKFYAVNTFGLIPGLAVTAANIVSFISCRITLTLLAETDFEDRIPVSMGTFSMSLISAICYTLAYMTMFVTSFTGGDTVALVAENVYIMLLPGLAFTGILVLLGRGVSRKRHIFTLILISLLAVPFFTMASAIAAFIGCVDIARTFASLRLGKDPDDPDNDPDD